MGVLIYCRGAKFCASTLVFSFSVCLLYAQETVTMKVVKLQTDTVRVYALPEASEYVVEPEEQNFTIVEQMPAYIGGDKALQKFLSDNINRQLVAERKISGVVYLSFVVDTLGQATRIKVVRGLDIVLDNEAIRLVSLMGEWTPGRQQNRPVAVQFTLPIRFQQ